MGKAALDGHAGIKSVARGWRNFREINTVYYDPSIITVEEMKNALKKAGTYMETIEDSRIPGVKDSSE